MDRVYSFYPEAYMEALRRSQHGSGDNLNSETCKSFALIISQITTGCIVTFSFLQAGCTSCTPDQQCQSS